MPAKNILLLNGPNLDMLGKREPEVYGSKTLKDLEESVLLYAQTRDVVLTSFQSNSESELVDKIHHADERYDGIVYNPGAHTHYSYALRDAVAAISVPTVEVHISDVDNREPFRAISVIAPVCVAQVKGLGFDGYCRALDILVDSAELERLGEGYEARFPAGANVIIAGEEAAFEDAARSQDAVPDELADRLPSGLPDVENFSASFASDIAAEDLGMTSFERQNRVRAVCERAGLDALLVRDTSNIRWISAFDDVFDEERAHALLIGRSRAALHTDSRYSNAIRTVAARISSSIAVDDRRMAHAKFAKEALADGADSYAGRMGIEDSITYAEFVKVAEEFGTANLSATTDLVLGLRAVKSEFELSRLLAAQAVTDAAFVHILRYVKPGMTEREVQLELEDYMLRHGAEGLAFSSIVAAGANGADPHAIPGNTRLEAGQCVVMDFGAKAFGYCSDMTRVLFLGRPDPLMSAAWDVLRFANESVEAMLGPGVTGKQAHELAERILAEGGFEGRMGHGLGHGVGLDVHELPVLNPRNETPLVAGNVVTVEPGIYLPGEFGMRLEDCGVVTLSGYETFSQIGHEMIVL